MQILLKRSVRSLGRAGDIVNVRDGYARNYLLPREIAVPASQGNLALVEKYKAHRAEEEAQMIQEYQEISTQINEAHLVLYKKANASNHLYGSVSVGEIVTQLNNRHINIEKDMVQLEHPLKELGLFDVVVKLTDSIQANLKVEIRDEHGEIPVLEGSLDVSEEEAPSSDDQTTTAEQTDEMDAPDASQAESGVNPPQPQ